MDSTYTPSPLTQLRQQLENREADEPWTADHWRRWASAQRQPDALHLRGPSAHTRLNIDPLWILMRLDDAASFQGWVEAGGCVDKCRVDAFLSWPCALADIVSRSPHTPWYAPLQERHHANEIPEVPHPGQVANPLDREGIAWRHAWLERLLKAGVSPMDPFTGQTVFHHLASRGGMEPSLLDLLCRHQAHALNQATSAGLTPLLMALASRHVPRVQHLLDRGAALTKEAWTPAMIEAWLPLARRGDRLTSERAQGWCDMRVALAAQGSALLPHRADDEALMAVESFDRAVVKAHLQRAQQAELVAAICDLPVHASVARRPRL